MYFTIRIVRFLLRLCIKTLLLPFKIIGAVVGAGSEDTSEYDPAGVDDSSAIDETASVRETTHDDNETTTAPTSTSDQTARQRISWFRTGLLAVGAVELLLGLVILVEAGQMLNSDVAAILVTALLFFGAAPLAIGWALPNHPAKAWYAGMAFVALQLVRAVITIPVGLVWLIVYGVIGVCGYTGRPALYRVYGTVSTPASTPTPEQSSNDRSTDIDPSTGIEMADDTAEATDDAVPSEPKDQSSGSDDAAGSAPPSPAATSAGEQSATSDADPDNSVTTADPPTRSASSADAGDETQSTEPVDESAEPSADEDEQSTEDTSSDAAVSTDIEAYRDGLAADDPEERVAAVRDLADAVAGDEVPDQAAIDALSERLDDDASSVRVAACEALGRLGADDVSSRLRDLRIDPDSDVSRAASRALQNLEQS